MNYDPEQHHRRSIRKERFDYTGAGGYFVTICTNDKRHLFGTVCNERMHLNDAGNVITKTWNILPTRFPTVKLNEFVIMPNHLHGIIVISDNIALPPDDRVGAGLVTGPSHTTGRAVFRIRRLSPAASVRRKV